MPWNIEKYTQDQESLPIDGPPCKDCYWWKPVRTYTTLGKASGICCCHAPEMFGDFSCYRSSRREK